MPSLAELRKQKLKEFEDVQDKKLILEEKQKIKIESLKPPKLPEINIPGPTHDNDDNFFIELATSTEFKRFIYKALYGKVHRTEKQHGNLDEKVQEGLKALRDPKFGNVIKEMRESFKSGLFKPSQIK